MVAKMTGYYDEEERRRRRWAKRREEMRRRKRRQALFRKLFPIGIVAVLVIVIAVVFTGRGRRAEKPDGQAKTEEAGQKREEAGQEQEENDKKPAEDEAASEEENKEEKKPEEEKEDKTKSKKSGSKGAESLVSAKTGLTVVALQERYEEIAEENRNTGKQVFQYAVTEDTLRLGEEVTGSYAIFVDTKEEKILACKAETSRLVPASMTKVLTLLVAVEHITDLDDEFEITRDITDYCFENDCSVAGFAVGEKVTIRDLLYGAILPSGGDGALGIAIYTAGSQEAFVELMNEKLAQLGLSESAHFTNCVGIYDDNHYCTAYDLAVIMEAAMQNEICREVLSSRTYVTSKTEEHPEGLELSNWFLRRIEDKDTGGMTMYGKTGYVDESGSCAVSAGIGRDGKEYICVIANARNKWYCITDHAGLYKRYSEG